MALLVIPVPLSCRDTNTLFLNGQDCILVAITVFPSADDYSNFQQTPKLNKNVYKVQYFTENDLTTDANSLHPPQSQIHKYSLSYFQTTEQLLLSGLKTPDNTISKINVGKVYFPKPLVCLNFIFCMLHCHLTLSMLCIDFRALGWGKKQTVLVTTN